MKVEMATANSRARRPRRRKLQPRKELLLSRAKQVLPRPSLPARLADRPTQLLLRLVVKRLLQAAKKQPLAGLQAVSILHPVVDEVDEDEEPFLEVIEVVEVVEEVALAALLLEPRVQHHLLQLLPLALDLREDANGASQ